MQRARTSRATRSAAAALIAVALALPREGAAECFSIDVAALRGTYGPGRTAQLNLGTTLDSVSSIAISVTGSGSPGLYEQCDMFTGECFQFSLAASAIYLLPGETPGNIGSFGSFWFGPQEATSRRPLSFDPLDFAVFLDGRAQLVLTHNGVVSIPEEPIYTLIAPEFTLSRVLVEVGGKRLRAVDFEEVAVPPGSETTPLTFVYSGVLRFKGEGGGLSRANAVLAADNGGTYLGHVPEAGPGAIVVTRADTTPFSLVSLDLAEWDGAAGTQVEIRGRRIGGAELVHSVVLDGIADGSGPARDFETVALDPAWTHLQEVRLAATSASSGAALAIDEIVSATSADLDGDGVDDGFDGCPARSDPDQTDTDGDGVGDACNDCEDPDGDEWGDALDGCPLVADPEQADLDADGWGDACDRCPEHADAQNFDRDGNGIGDACECGDQNGDGRVDVLDLVAIQRAIFDPSRVTPLCDTNADGRCDVQDVVGANLKIFGAPAWCSRYPPPAH